MVSIITAGGAVAGLAGAFLAVAVVAAGIAGAQAFSHELDVDSRTDAETLLSGWGVDGVQPRFHVRSGTVRAVDGDDVILQVSRTT